MALKRRYSIVTALAVALLATVVPEADAQQTAKPSKAAKAVATGDSVGAPAQKIDASTAQTSLETSVKLLAAGKVEPAIATLSSLISAGNLPAPLMARALYLRGTAYRQQSKPALAISDLTSALWLKSGLSDTDRSDATQQRAAAYSDAGLTDQGEAIAAAGASRHKSGPSTTTQASAPTPAAGGLFAGLFGGAPSAAAVPAPKDASAPRAPVDAPKIPKVQPPQASTPVGTSPPPTTLAMARAPMARVDRGSDQFRSRVALVRTKAEADAIVAKLKAQYSTVMADRYAEVGETAFGNMGTFYQVRVGPFATSAEAQAMCGSLKGSGLDCVAVSR